MNDRLGRNGTFSIIGVALVGLCLVATMVVPAHAQDSPVIDVWYGHYQRYGHIGAPQPWANILGNVSDSDGIVSLTYSLNGGSSVVLTVGPDGHRLASPGDFNIDLATADLVEGLNDVIITAVDNDSPSNQTVDTVTVDYTSGNVWPLTYSVDWDTVTAIENAGQVVDGLWALTDSTVRTTIPGYDRLIAMGDMAWDDYEITVPITIHTMPSDFGVGILLRWNGHTDTPLAGTQPKSGYFPLGTICWYQYGRLNMFGNNADNLGTVGRSLSLDVPYIFKVRVETVPGVGGYYSFKVWEKGQPEPSVWDITGQEELSDPQGGSFMLLGHQADVSFGDVTVTPVPLSIRNISVTLGAGRTEATIAWTTNEPATSSVAYGLTTGYELGTESDPLLVTDHGITLTGLTPDTLYHYEITSVDSSSDSVSSEDRTFSTAVAVDLSGIVSDDFSSETLNTSVWTPVDPLGDGTMTLTGSGTSDAWVNLSVPAGVEHQVYASGIQALHLLQAANDTDFEIEVKYESPVSQQYQQQGVVVKQDDDNYLRFEFYGTSSTTILYARGFTSSSSPFYFSKTVGGDGIAPLYMRIKREGDQWTQSYSLDGIDWTFAPPFTHVMTVGSLGPYSGNASGAGSPAHTASVDYFFNVASPIDPEDQAQSYALTANVVGNGSVTKVPDQPTYVYGDTVIVTAVPDAGWVFDGWSDGLTGTETSDTLVMVSDTMVTATFIQEQYTLTINLIGNGSVTKVPDQPTYVYGDTVIVTAVPDTGWVFDGWSDGLTGTETPDTLVMVSDTTITATFTQEEYTLTINVVGSGSVMRPPDQLTYVYGDTVIVTAVPDTGWVFDGWSDGLTGTETPDTLVMVSDTTITATFTQEEFALITNIVGSGSVTKVPDQPTYIFGDTVIVAAAPDTGWVFDGWSDGLTGTETPDTLVMVSNTTITATFRNITTGIEEIVPSKFTLFQNVPNPFNPTTAIRFDLPRPAHVKLFVYNIKGELVATIIDNDMTAGRKEITWTATNNKGSAVASGIYFYRLVAGGFVQTKKMAIVR